MLQLWCCNTNKSVPTVDGWFCLYLVYCHTALCEGFHRAFTTSPSVLCICKYGLCGVHLLACFVKCNLAVGSSTELITLCYQCSTIRGLFWSCSVVLLSSDAPLCQLISICSWWPHLNATLISICRIREKSFSFQHSLALSLQTYRMIQMVGKWKWGFLSLPAEIDCLHGFP